MEQSALVSTLELIRLMIKIHQNSQPNFGESDKWITLLYSFLEERIGITESQLKSDGFTTIIKQKLIQVGAEYIESGLVYYDEWYKAFSSLFDLRIIYPEIKDDKLPLIFQNIWHSSFMFGKKEMTLCERANELKDKHTPQGVYTSIDKLFQTLETYRKSEFFLQMLEFCAKFKDLAPYNAMMVKTQMPSARYVLNKKQWMNRYQRVPKMNARPLVILRKYGPVDYVFEIADTEPKIPSMFPDDIDKILEHMANPYKTDGQVSNELYNTLLSHLSFYGIHFDTFRVGSSFGAQISKRNCKVMVREIETKGYYCIYVNDKADKATSFASICHELGHLFCHHLVAPNKNWWNWRSLSWEEEEFEAEIVSYIICERYGVGNKSWEYLADVLGRWKEIPKTISVERIFKAANEVEKMLEIDLDPKTCFLFYNDASFKKEYLKKYPNEKIELKEDDEKEN